MVVGGSLRIQGRSLSCTVAAASLLLYASPVLGPRSAADNGCVRCAVTDSERLRSPTHQRSHFVHTLRPSSILFSAVLRADPSLSSPRAHRRSFFPVRCRLLLRHVPNVPVAVVPLSVYRPRHLARAVRSRTPIVFANRIATDLRCSGLLLLLARRCPYCPTGSNNPLFLRVSRFTVLRVLSVSSYRNIPRSTPPRPHAIVSLGVITIILLLFLLLLSLYDRFSPLLLHVYHPRCRTRTHFHDRHWYAYSIIRAFMYIVHNIILLRCVRTCLHVLSFRRTCTYIPQMPYS